MVEVLILPVSRICILVLYKILPSFSIYFMKPSLPWKLPSFSHGKSRVNYRLWFYNGATTVVQKRGVQQTSFLVSMQWSYHQSRAEPFHSPSCKLQHARSSRFRTRNGRPPVSRGTYLLIVSKLHHCKCSTPDGKDHVFGPPPPPTCAIAHDHCPLFHRSCEMHDAARFSLRWSPILSSN